MTSTIATEGSTEGRLATFVNVFTCEPEDQDQLVETLERETEQVVSRLPGFVSANIHRSVDGCRVVNYAQWAQLDAFQAFMRGERGRAMIEQAHRYARSVDVHLYQVHSIFSAADLPLSAAAATPPQQA